LPDSSTAATRRFVPPRSTPMAKEGITGIRLRAAD
jgi:hypothetical protein